MESGVEHGQAWANDNLDISYSCACVAGCVMMKPRVWKWAGLG